MKIYIFQSHDLETFSLAIRFLFQEYHKRMKEKGWDDPTTQRTITGSKFLFDC